MENILHDLSTPTLNKAIEENIFSIFASFRHWHKAEVYEDASMLRSITDIPFPLFNSIVRTKLEEAEIDPTITRLTEEAKARGVPLLWWTGPQTSPVDLGNYLVKHGFVKEEDMPGMAIELDNLRDDLPVPAGFRFERLEDDASIMQWNQVTGQGFGMPDFVIEAFYEFLNCVDRGKMKFYLGWLDRTPVATSTLFMAAGVAGIFNVATIPEARRKGIGAIMTAFPLREARKLGYYLGTLFATKMGVGVYRSLGFQEYCKIGQYVWMPERS